MQEDFFEILDYDKINGKIKNRVTNRFLSVQEDGYCVVVFKSGKIKKIKFNKLCLLLGSGVDVPKDCKIIHRNLNSKDFRLCNLMHVTRDEYKELREALKNIQGGITVLPHPTDVFTYKVSWYSYNTKKTRVIQDLVVAKRLEIRLKLKYSKIISKFCIFEE